MANTSHSSYSSIARPYALAAFEFARDKQQLPQWKSFFDSTTDITSHASVIKLLENPEVSSAKLLALFCDILRSFILGSILCPQQENFLKLLANNKRFNLLQEIAQVFNQYTTDHEKTSTVRVVTAIEASAEFKEKLSQALTKRMQHQTKLRFEVDPTIIGGAVIHIGDRVIDGSISGKLTRLLNGISN